MLPCTIDKEIHLPLLPLPYLSFSIPYKFFEYFRFVKHNLISPIHPFSFVSNTFESLLIQISVNRNKSPASAICKAFRYRSFPSGSIEAVSGDLFLLTD